MSSALIKVDSADTAGGYAVDKLVSTNGSIQFTPITGANGVKQLDLSASTGPYEVYTALLFDDGAGNITPVVLANTLSAGSPAWVNTGTNTFEAQLTGGFPDGKTWCCITVPDPVFNSVVISAGQVTPDACQFVFRQSVASAKGIQIEIRVYNAPPNTGPPNNASYVQTSGNYSVAAGNKIIGVTDPAHEITVDPTILPVGGELIIQDESDAVVEDETPIQIFGPFPNGVTVVTISVNLGTVKLYSNGVDTLYITSQ